MDRLAEERPGRVESPASTHWSTLRDFLGATDLPGCATVDVTGWSPERFVREVVLRQRPVVLRSRDDLSQWPAHGNWTVAELHRAAGRATVHVKASADGAFEGSEPLGLWASARGRPLPPAIAHQLASPALVVSRPADLDTELARVLSWLYDRDDACGSGPIAAGGSSCGFRPRWLAAAPRRGPVSRPAWAQPPEAGAEEPLPADATFYVEYHSMPRPLRRGAPAPRFGSLLGEAPRQQLWLGDGRTVGKLHADAFENVLVMVRGSKHLLLVPPYDGVALGEGHLREAKWSMSRRRGVGGRVEAAFERAELLESTSIVNTAVDVASAASLAAAGERFRGVAGRARACSVSEGEALFLPSYWWHEVVSEPGRDPGSGVPIGLAVNFWWPPLFHKPQSCAACPVELDLRDAGFDAVYAAAHGAGAQGTRAGAA